MQSYTATPEYGETYKLEIQHYADLTGWTVKLYLYNGTDQVFTSPCPEVQVDGFTVTLTFPTPMVEQMHRTGPTYRLVATDPNLPAGYGDEIILSGRVKVAR